MHPAEKTELLLQITLFQRHDESHEADGVEREADDPVVCSERKEIRIRKHNMLEVVQTG